MNRIASEIERLSKLVTDHKRTRIAQVLSHRTRHVTVALENVLQPHNASAVIRSCDIFGVQDLHVVEAIKKFKPDNAIAKGAGRWTDVHPYASTAECLDALKKSGYRIVATTPHERGVTLPNFSVNQKTALFFGTEISGLSDEVLSRADDFVTIPMYGFTESFNISVSVALCLYHCVAQLQSDQSHWRLSLEERQEIELRWLRQILHMD